MTSSTLRSEDDPRLIALAREYLAELEAGRRPDRGEYERRHPELATAVGECLEGMELAHAMGSAMRPMKRKAEPPTGPLGDFRIVREIARGGMGVVYEAVQVSLGRRVALKILPHAAALDARSLQRFQTEAHAAAQLNHPNIVPVYAVGHEGDTHYYAMQLIDGRPLDAVIASARGDDGPRRGGVTTFPAGGHSTDGLTSDSPSKAPTERGRDAYRTAASLALQAAHALQYAHECGVVHRDVKPGNLLLDGKGHVWVADFGLAHIVSDTALTQTGEIVGTLRYMSPEQAEGKRWQVDHRTDVYSLGATLFELLTLECMRPEVDRPGLLRRLLHDEPPKARAIDKGVPIELETIVGKATARAPEERYSTAAALADDLQRFLDGRPILARAPSVSDRARKWLRRHPGAAVAVGLFLACLAVGLAVTTALVAREQSHTKEAYRQERQRAAEVEDRFALARQSADEMIRIADEELGDNPATWAVRRRLLERALDFYQELIRRQEHDLRARADLEATRQRVGEILADLAVARNAERHMLLSEADVRRDLKLDVVQSEAMDRMTRTIEATVRSRTSREAELAEMRSHDALIARTLSPEQQRRLGQIALQWHGRWAFDDPDVVDRLRLTREQRERIRQVSRPPGDRDEAMRSALAILDDDQRAVWAEMTGPPFAGTFRKGKDFGPPRKDFRPKGG